MSKYYFNKTVGLSFEDAIARVTEELKKEGFGILTEIDMSATMKKKLDVDIRPYKILGACNPPFAHQALQAELEVGLMLPCNVVVYEGDDQHAVVVAVDPTTTVATTGNPKLVALAETVKAKLTAALARLE